MRDAIAWTLGLVIVGCGTAPQRPPRPPTTPLPAPASVAPPVLPCVSPGAIALTVHAVDASIPLDDARLRHFARRHADEITAALARERDHYANLPEVRSASHILVRVSEDADAATVDAARARAEALLVRARSGESFVGLAREASEDVATAALGGALGWSPRGRYVSAFEEAVFGAAQTGVIPALVRTQFGFHVIRVDDMLEAGDMPPILAREDIARRMYVDEREGDGATWMLQPAAFECRNLGWCDLEAFRARHLGDVDDTDVFVGATVPFDRDATIVVSDEEPPSLAPSLFVLPVGEISQPLLIGGVAYLFIGRPRVAARVDGTCGLEDGDTRAMRFHLVADGSLTPD